MVGDGQSVVGELRHPTGTEVDFNTTVRWYTRQAFTATAPAAGELRSTVVCGACGAEVGFRLLSREDDDRRRARNRRVASLGAIIAAITIVAVLVTVLSGSLDSYDASGALVSNPDDDGLGWVFAGALPLAVCVLIGCLIARSQSRRRGPVIRPAPPRVRGHAVGPVPADTGRPPPAPVMRGPTGRRPFETLRSVAFGIWCLVVLLVMVSAFLGVGEVVAMSVWGAATLVLVVSWIAVVLADRRRR